MSVTTISIMTKKMPVLFVGHGSPMNAIENNEFSKTWEKLGKELPKPKLILCISAHWLNKDTRVTGEEEPKTIHDFYGFPQELYQIQYPAKGSVKDAEMIAKLLKSVKVKLDYAWGLDHGTWSVLRRMYPKADIPVIQLSINYYAPLEEHYKIGKELASLREKGVLIIGSGNIVHNLMQVDFSAKPYPWAIEFDEFVKSNVEKKNHLELINYQKNKSAELAHPTNDHYRPLIYALGAAGKDKIEFFNDKIIAGSLSMRSIKFG